MNKLMLGLITGTVLFVGLALAGLWYLGINAEKFMSAGTDDVRYA